MFNKNLLLKAFKNYNKSILNLTFNKNFCSSVKIGSEFETFVVLTLNKKGFLVERCGKTKDGGIDFRGFLLHTNKENSIKVIGQCKKENRQIGPGLIREFDGVLSNLNEQILGIFVSFM
eukprot:TRINITY_DN1201_c6_g1_i1.p1 TRINITY_DN1201_c6_g1~~TRINITY_DN1201_c6_g1_i1.p1  ORF type:complete len:129 (-),score=21.86 TRINITY_DN1201_c6_g1_i1:443-799(-)